MTGPLACQRRFALELIERTTGSLMLWSTSFGKDHAGILSGSFEGAAEDRQRADRLCTYRDSCAGVVEPGWPPADKAGSDHPLRGELQTHCGVRMLSLARLAPAEKGGTLVTPGGWVLSRPPWPPSIIVTSPSRDLSRGSPSKRLRKGVTRPPAKSCGLAVAGCSSARMSGRR